MALKKGGARSSLRNVQVGSAIPDSEDLLLHYDATKMENDGDASSDGDAVSTWTDQKNTSDLTAGTAATYKTNIINSNPVVRFDGTDDYLNNTDGDYSDKSQPYQVFFVMSWNSRNSGDQAAWDTSSADNPQFSGSFLEDFNSAGTNEIFASSNVFGSTSDTSFHIFNTFFNGSSSVIRKDGSQTGSGDSGTRSFGQFYVGDSANNNNSGNFDMGEILVYPQDKTGIESDVESYLSDKWGITI